MREILQRYHTNVDAMHAFEAGVLPPWRDRPARLAVPMFDVDGVVCGAKVRPGFHSKSDDLRGSRTGLLGLPTLRAMPDARVIVVEGDHDGLAVKAAFPEFSIVAFPGVGRWPRGFTDRFRSRDVTVVPHLDEPGQAIARRIVQELHGVASAVRIADLRTVAGVGP
ncbi:MAG: hypothetical protein HYR85_08140 [Planctomycetes bacterium]|nr:hypothetical protein [Planctomycetota bacterium]MBI3843243.1 hypothetical protein [Planctomycetota bacterium]